MIEVIDSFYRDMKPDFFWLLFRLYGFVLVEGFGGIRNIFLEEWSGLIYIGIETFFFEISKKEVF